MLAALSPHRGHTSRHIAAHSSPQGPVRCPHAKQSGEEEEQPSVLPSEDHLSS